MNEYRTFVILITAVFAFLITVIAGGFMYSGHVINTEADRESVLVEAGLQQCPLLGSTKIVWQKECD